MTIRRRDALVAISSAAVGAVGMFGGEGAASAEDARNPLPTYGTSVSAVRPDTSRPSATRGSVVWSGPRPAPSDPSAVRRLALTFDDGPHPQWTPRVLAALARHGASATFFVRGDNLAAYPSIHEAGAPHEIANHTWDHPDLGRLTYAEVAGQLSRTSDLIARSVGHPPTRFRPPYGHLGGSTLLAAAEAGLETVLWSAQMREGSVAGDPDAIVRTLREQVAPGDVILAHDSGSADRVVTIDRLDAILDGLHEDGYELVTLSQLLDPAPTATD